MNITIFSLIQYLPTKYFLNVPIITLLLPLPTSIPHCTTYTSLGRVLPEHTTMLVKGVPAIALWHGGDEEARSGTSDINMRHLRHMTRR
jgi:hypothetical protein